MTREFMVRKYDNGAVEFLLSRDADADRKVLYNNGDVVYFRGTKVVAVIPHNTNMRWPDCENPDTSAIDSLQAPRETTEARAFAQQKKVLAILAKDPHYYDDYVSAFVNKNLKEGEAPTKITQDMVLRFFDIPGPSREITISVKRSGTCGFDVNIHAAQNPALIDEAIRQLDVLLFDHKNLSWLMGIYTWAISYKTGNAYRHFSGDSKEAQTLLQRWFKNCTQKMGKNLTIESHMSV